MLPHDANAYKLESLDPTYTVPSDPIAGLEITLFSVVYFQCILPHDAKAYKLLSTDPTYTVVPSDLIAGLEIT